LFFVGAVAIDGAGVRLRLALFGVSLILAGFFLLGMRLSTDIDWL
jgi:hypothetical protein